MYCTTAEHADTAQRWRRKDATMPRRNTDARPRGGEHDEQAAPAQGQLPEGFVHSPGALDRAEQETLLAAIMTVLDEAPLYTPTMPRSGRPLSVRMSNCGPLGWVSDKDGYRYQPQHPETGRPWPEMPDQVRSIWSRFAPGAPPPEACLINVYEPGTRLGSHVDRDEDDISAPVVSVSLGDDAVFHVGGRTRTGPKRRLTLRSGDVVVLGGAARLAYHGVDRILPGTGDLLGRPGRINLTLRRVTAPD